MTRIERSVIISAPRLVVFAYASDYRKWSEWFEGVSEFTPMTSLTHGTGARYSYKARMKGIGVSVETEIRDFIINEGWKGISTKGVSASTYWNFQALGDNTKFTYVLEYKLPAPWFLFLADAIIVKPQWEKIIEKSLSNLKLRFSAIK
jgi:hypothetical protein